MPPTDKSKTYTGVGAGASGVSSLVSILAFALPYWVYYEEDLTLSDGTGSHQVQWTYYYGFWKFCNKVSSDVSNSDRCGSVDSHSDVEQTTAVLLLLAILLFVSGVVNACLFLTILKKEKLCLYIAWISGIVAGVFALTSIIIFAGKDHSVTVTSDITLNFSTSKLHASFWLVVIGCIMVAIATVFITLAIINVHRTEEKSSDDKKSMISYDSVNKSSNKLIEDDDDITEEHNYKEPKIPEAFPYTDSPYSTSSESLSDLDELYDSDDSDIGPKFAKLKTKVTPKPSDVKRVENETSELRRCRSGELLTMARLDGSLTPKIASSSLHRSRSASALTPVERADDLPDYATIDSNPLYQDSKTHIEAGKAPVATNLIVTMPPPASGSGDTLVLRRAKTDMPLTQKMMNTIGLKRKEPHDSSVREPAEIDPEKTSLSLPLKVKSFPKKPHKSKSKHKKPSEEGLRRMRELTDVYATPPPLRTYFPGQQSHKPAPWSKAREKFVLRPKTSKTMKWSLHAHGVESIPKFPKHLKSPKKRQTAPVSKEDAEPTDVNSSMA
ncbi:uncharacterized protein LOC123542800 [Mercenaria mercenaria]|uniref:uncharacterized protein LOC123542800 n=1 Tax=Mercenaria mercenaria TaxID=6596 RepID=UPI00234F4B61|nr:uncharacterized protein LOC123542800 [Mercenaria mercenaria]